MARTTPGRTSTLSSAPPPPSSPPPPDLFVLVRPPPSSAGHPLNVQIQLLEPSSARGAPVERPLSRLSAATGPSTRRSTDGRSFGAVAGASVGHSGEGPADDGDGEDDEVGREVRARSRSPSVSSTRSGTSGESTWTSGTSASGGTHASGSRRRTVKPLLNLNCHNLLPTVVTDAGTEQRVARFHKRGIELTGLAIFDPTHLVPAGAASPAFLSVPSTPPVSNKADSGFLGKFKRLSFNPSTSPSALSSSTPSHAPDSAPAPHTLSLIRTPSPSAPIAAGAPGADARPGYAFLLRKWLRADLLDAPRGIRVEWTRAPIQRRQRSRAGRRSAPANGRGSAHAEEDAEVPEEDEVEEEEEEEEERAWLCTLVYPLSGSAASPSLGSDPSSPASSPASSPPISGAPSAGQRARRLALATLRPAPHHPKLVSTLLLPPALPSIPLGSFHPARGLVGGALAPADLRDLAMVTALFVAVREGLGGLESAAGEAALGHGHGYGHGLSASRSAGAAGGDAPEGMAALTEKAGLAIQGLVPVGSGAKRRAGTQSAGGATAPRAGGFAAGLGRLFGAK
ncbi:hypothetical protein JCM3770_005973 [Rhodotorula araucariae]